MREIIERLRRLDLTVCEVNEYIATVSTRNNSRGVVLKHPAGAPAHEFTIENDKRSWNVKGEWSTAVEIVKELMRQA